jgi:acyl-coenzyme A synthetase/AMP-(fatty) acid ligase
MKNLPVYEVLKESAEKWPDLPAVYDEYGILTFKELYFEAEALRLKLIEIGIGKGMAIGVMARNGRNFISAIFAVIGTGAAVMPMSHQLKGAEIEDILNSAQLHGIMDDQHGSCPIEGEKIMLDMAIDAFRFSFSSVDRAAVFAPHVPEAAFMRFTSGTTGKSKGVIISHKSAIERVTAANKILDLGPGDSVVWVLPMAYHFVVSILLYVKYGAAIAVVQDFLPKNIIDSTNEHLGTLLYASPMQIRLLANSTGNNGMPSLKRVISTSAAISPEVCVDFHKRFNIHVSQAYGIIEIGLPMINYLKFSENPEAVGQVLPDYDVQIFDEDNTLLPDGSIGRLGIKGPGMFDAYLTPPALREEVLVNGYFLTADFASKSKDGLVKVEGREKSMINISGNKVFPEEVEGVLESWPEIKMAKISGIPHPLMGQIIQAEVILEDGCSIDVEEVLTFCRKRLSTYKIPQRVKIVDELPMTSSGKIIRY